MDTTETHLDHPFILLIKKAEHIVVEKTSNEDLFISKNKLEFNGFSKIDDFKNELSTKFDEYSGLIDNEMNSIPFKADKINFLNTILKDLNSIKTKIFKLKDDRIIFHSAYNLNNDIKDNFYSENESAMASVFFEVQYQCLVQCIKKVNQEIQDLKSLTQEDIDRTYGTSSGDLSKCLGIKKIKTSLTVEELAFFFKILKDANIFNPTNVTDFGKMASEIFSSKKKETFTQETFMKEYHKSHEKLHDASLKFSVDLLPLVKKIADDYRNLKK